MSHVVWLLWNCPYSVRLDDTDVVEKTVVLVVVRNDDAAFLLLRQHEQYIVLNVATSLNEGGVDVAVGTKMWLELNGLFLRVSPFFFRSSSTTPLRSFRFACLFRS